MSAGQPIDAAMRPALGDIVLYRGKFGLHAFRAAIVSCTVETLMREGVQAGEIADLDSDTHVHLHVLTPSDTMILMEYNIPLAVGAEVQPGEWAPLPRRDRHPIR